MKSFRDFAGKTIIKALMLIFGFGFLISCSSKRIVIKEPTPEEEKYASHMEEHDIVSLMDDYVNYIDYRENIGRYLFDDSNYEDDNYIQLCNYEEYSRKDSALSEYFFQLKEDREEKALEYIADAELEDIIKYYRENEDEQGFLKEYIEEPLYEVVDNADYYELREINELCSGTDLGGHVNEVWKQEREIMIKQAKESLNEMFQNEKKLLTYYTDEEYTDIEEYMNEVITDITEECLQAIGEGVVDLLIVELKTDNTPLRDRMENVINQVIVDYSINEILDQWSKDYINSIIENHEEMYQLLTGKNNDYISNMKELNNFSYISYKYSGRDLDKIEKIQDKNRKKRNKTSVITTAASFMIPGGALGKAGKIAARTTGLILDGTDIFVAISSSKEEAEEVQQLFSSFIEQTTAVLMDKIRSQVSGDYRKIDEMLELEQANLGNRIYEDL